MPETSSLKTKAWLCGGAVLRITELLRCRVHGKGHLLWKTVHVAGLLGWQEKRAPRGDRAHRGQQSLWFSVTW